MAAPPPPPSRGFSLYDNLQDPNDVSSSATISSAPVIYSQAEGPGKDSAPKKPVDASLRFQPIRRPQIKQTKPKATFPKIIPKAAPLPNTNALPTTVPAPPSKSTLADWAATEDNEWIQGVGEKRQRGGRRKKKKQQHTHLETDWDELYDPTRPTNIDEFLKSDEKVEEIREWKSLLYRHRRKQDESDISDDDEVENRPMPPSKHIIESQIIRHLNNPRAIRSVCSAAVIFIRSTSASTPC